MKKISLLVLPLILFIGCGSTKTNTITETQSSVETQTVTAPTKTVTRTIHVPIPEKQAPESSTQEFSGNGGKNLGTITVTKESVIEWTDDGEFFAINTSSGIPVNSQARKGSSILEEGTYSHFEVNALGNWTIKIVPK